MDGSKPAAGSSSQSDPAATANATATTTKAPKAIPSLPARPAKRTSATASATATQAPSASTPASTSVQQPGVADGGSSSIAGSSSNSNDRQQLGASSSSSSASTSTGNGSSGSEAARQHAPKLPARPQSKKPATAATASQSTAAPSSSSSAPTQPASITAVPPNSTSQQQQQQGTGSSTAAPSSSSSSNSSSSKPSGSSSSGPSLPARPTAGGPGKPAAGLPLLPPRQQVMPNPAGGPVLDPDEPEEIQDVRRKIHGIRVSLIRSAQRLGYGADHGLVKQVLYRLNLAEKLKAPWRKGRRPDPSLAAAREAARLEGGAEGSKSPLGFKVKMMLVGVSGGGKTQLALSLLDDPSGAAQRAGLAGWQQVAVAAAAGGAGGRAPEVFVDPLEGATRRVQVLSGTMHGVEVEILDTPGLRLSPSQAVENGRVLRQIKKAYQQQRPDLLVYVDRLDRPLMGPGQLPALQDLSMALGPGVWLNTIVVLTHGGVSPPRGPHGPLAFDLWASQRSQQVQQAVREASGDGRLMNPMAFVEAHPGASRSPDGSPLLYHGLPWQPHLLLMLLSAKLLSDTEALLQVQEDGSSPGGAAAELLLAQRMAGGGKALPVSYLMAGATQQTRPLKFSDHHSIMEVRRAQAQVAREVDPVKKRDLARQVKQRLMQMRMANAQREKMSGAFHTATLAGSKITPAPPQVATRRAPGVTPPLTHRYRVPEAQGGWVVRPHIEPHGVDGSDGIEGLYLEKSGVARAQPDDLAGGLPYHHSLSAQCQKEQFMVQAKSEASLYHDRQGRLITSLSAEGQMQGGPGAGAPDALLQLRADTRAKAGQRHKATAGVMLARLADGCRPDRGPLALAARLQHAARAHLGATPLETSAVLAYMVAQAASGPGGSGPAGPEGAEGGAEGEGDGVPWARCLGANVEVNADLAEVLDLNDPLLLGVNASLARQGGEAVTAVAGSVTWRRGSREMVGLRCQVGNRGKGGVNLKVKSSDQWWLGPLAMACPLASWLGQVVGLIK